MKRLGQMDPDSTKEWIDILDRHGLGIRLSLRVIHGEWFWGCGNPGLDFHENGQKVLKRWQKLIRQSLRRLV